MHYIAWAELEPLCTYAQLFLFLQFENLEEKVIESSRIIITTETSIKTESDYIKGPER